MYSAKTSIDDRHDDLFIHTRLGSDLVTQCGHEILSVFILTVATKIKSIGGETNRHSISGEGYTAGDPSKRQRSLTNSFLQEIAQEIVDANMAHDMTEAYTLVIPAFARYNLLPTRADNDTAPDDDGGLRDDAGYGNRSEEEEDEGVGHDEGRCQNDNVDIREEEAPDPTSLELR